MNVGFFVMCSIFGSFKGQVGVPPNGVPMVFIVFSRDSWGF